MTVPLALAIANAAIMAIVALAGARTPRWIRASSWMLLAGSLAVVALYLVDDARGLPDSLLAIASLISTCLNASALAPLVMQGILSRAGRPRRRVARTE
ncbi:hypothetical protein ACMA46_06370 [Clavibacter sp. Sh2141]|uniref:hypothetical protein n=1 Tax=Clavibacter sp. Sh2141 TaxID=3395374 RepID=UPI0039BD614E